MLITKQNYLAIFVIFMSILFNACEQNGENQNSNNLPNSKKKPFSILASKGVKFKIPNGFTEPAAIIKAGESIMQKEITIAYRGREYIPSYELVLLGPEYRRDGALICLWVFDFNPQDFPIGIIAFSPDKWVSQGANIVPFKSGSEQYLAAPVSFGNVKAYEVRACRWEIIYPADNPLEIIEDRYYCKDGKFFVSVKLEAAKKAFDHYERTSFKQFLESIDITK